MKTYMFPGQGSQRKGMGGALFDEFQALTRAADEILNYSIKRLCLEDPDNKLNSTQFTQPALYAVNALSYYKKLEESGRPPDFVAGHSLGEFNALLAAECFDFETGLRLVAKRGELMAQATEGGMAAVLNTTEAETRAILENNQLTAIDLANFNTPSQIVLSGRVEDIKAAQPLFQTGKRLFILLNTSGAFHSRYMDPARRAFEAFLEPLACAAPKIPVISNVTARPHVSHLIKESMVKQIVSSVRWSDSVEYLMGYEGMEFEEVGHGDVLTKLVQKIRREIPNPKRHVEPVATQPRTSAVEPVATRPRTSAFDLVQRWNDEYPVGTRVRSRRGTYGDLQTATPATVLFGHRAAIYMNGYRGYFDLNEIEPVR